MRDKLLRLIFITLKVSLNVFLVMIILIYTIIDIELS